MVEYLTEDGLFSIDIALRPPQHSRRSQPQRTHVAPAATAVTESAAKQHPSGAGADGADAAQARDDEWLDPADSAAAGPAAGRFLMLRSGFRLKGPQRWLAGRDGIDDPQPSEELQVRRSPSFWQMTAGVVCGTPRR